MRFKRFIIPALSLGTALCISVGVLGVSRPELVERAKAAGVRVYALSAYYMPPVRPPRATLVLGYAGMTGEQIDEAAARLRRAWTKEM